MSATCACGKPAKARGKCWACLSRERRADPVAAERDRANARAWKNTHREENRARDRERARTPEMRGECDTCGGPKGIGSARKHATCQPCIDAAAHLKREMLVELWSQGATFGEIMAAFGWTKGHVSIEMHTARQLGYDLPYRRTPEQRARMIAGRQKLAA